jgi:O-antigen/teichoic acid export membrane protein
MSLINKKIITFIQHKYSKNTSWLLVGKGVEMIITLFVGVMVARYMSEFEYGMYNYALSIVTIFSILSNLGLSNIITQEIVNSKMKSDEILGSALYLKFFGAILSILLALLVTIVLGNTKYTLLLVGISSIPILIKSLDVISYYFDAEVLSKYGVFSKVMGVIFSNSLKLATVILDLDIIFIYISLIIDSFFFVSFLLFFYNKVKDQNVLNWAKNKLVAKDLFKKSWPLMFTGIIYVFYLRIDQIMIKELINPEMLGHYSAAVKLSSAFHTLPWLITGSLFPALLNAFKSDKALFNKRYSLLVQFLVLLSIMFIIPITFLSHWIIELLYNGKYQLAENILQIHIWSSIFVFIGYATIKWFVAHGLQKISLICMVIGALFNLIANYLVIPKYGIIGVAYVTLFSQALTFIIMPGFFTKSRQLFKVQIVAMLKAFSVIIPIKEARALLEKKDENKDA